MAAELRCPSCSDAVLETQKFCPNCGTAVGEMDAPTGTAPRPLARTPVSPTPKSGTPRSVTPASGRAVSGSGRSRAAGGGSSPDRFSAGDLLLERYRIVGLLGRGGMGEVYKAEDLKLGQPVALKFLPEALQKDAERLERFYNEARMAREVSHPAVCRVHDIGEVDGHHFLSMEYVDGEDLASLVRRIGRLPGVKAIDIARQICAGLGAAHGKGVLHRDLKPQNLMLDGRGNVRITDFGLAGLAETIQGDDVRSGTPAYMSPEQLAGREVTQRSDIYALGLVLYELFTGRRPYPGRSFAEIKKQHQEPLAAPSDLVADVAPEVEITILRCLDRDPARRPPSALAVAALLQGSDPLAAALAAGETPSPEMVAASGRTDGIKPAKAWASVAVIVLATSAVFALSGSRGVLNRLPGVKSTQVLEDRARELLRKISPAAPAADHAVSYGADGEFLRWVEEQPKKGEQWDRIVTGEPAPVFFWYRQGPRSLVPLRDSSEVLWVDPPITTSGMSGVRVDLSGRLLSYYMTPPQLDDVVPSTAALAPDWSVLFAEARLDPSAFKPTEPKWAPPFFCDRRVAWEGTYPQRPDIPLRVEAAAYRGQPVSFFLVGPWTRPERMGPVERKGWERAGELVVTWLLLALLVSGGLLAWHHIRSGRGDRRGAFRLAILIATLNAASWILGTHHVADRQGEMELAARGAGEALLAAFILWVFYLALEPYVRRFWPHTIISWTRFLGGAVRDPLVGRDLLAGATWGACLALLLSVSSLLPEWLGQGTAAPTINYLDALLGPSRVIALLAVFPFYGIRLAVAALLILLLLKRVLRNERLAAWTLGILLTVIQALEHTGRGNIPAWLGIPLAIVIMGSFTLLLLRFGLLSAALGVAFANAFLAMPLTTDLRSWSSGPIVLVLVSSGLLVFFAFRASQGTGGVRARTG
jgi:serine/threonine-protein kinase